MRNRIGAAVFAIIMAGSILGILIIGFGGMNQEKDVLRPSPVGECMPDYDSMYRGVRTQYICCPHEMYIDGSILHGAICVDEETIKKEYGDDGDSDSGDVRG